MADQFGSFRFGLSPGSDFDKQAQHDEIREEAALALRACEKQGFPDTKSLRRWTCLTAWSAHFQR